MNLGDEKLLKDTLVPCIRGRIQFQCADGLSQVNLNMGVIAGRDMLDFVAIHLTASARS